MKPGTIAALGLTGCALVGTARADNLTGADKFMCSTNTAAACCDDGQCAAGSASDLNIPQFIQVDLAAKSISSTKASGKFRSSVVQNAKRENGQILLQGMENGRAYSILIDEKSGDLSAAIASSFGCGVTVFGACTPMTASK